jgi:hypothetical protein
MVGLAVTIGRRGGATRLFPRKARRRPRSQLEPDQPAEGILRLLPLVLTHQSLLRPVLENGEYCGGKIATFASYNTWAVGMRSCACISVDWLSSDLDLRFHQGNERGWNGHLQYGDP